MASLWNQTPPRVEMGILKITAVFQSGKRDIYCQSDKELVSTRDNFPTDKNRQEDFVCNHVNRA